MKTEKQVATLLRSLSRKINAIGQTVKKYRGNQHEQTYQEAGSRPLVSQRYAIMPEFNPIILGEFRRIFYMKP